MLVESDVRLLATHVTLMGSVNPHIACATASTVPDALQLLRAEPGFSIVLTDLHFQDEPLAGIEVVKDAVRAGVRAVYAMGRQIDPEMVELALSSGAQGVLRKGNIDIMVGHFTRCFRYERIVP